MQQICMKNFPILQISIEMNGMEWILPICQVNVTTTLIQLNLYRMSKS